MESKLKRLLSLLMVVIMVVSMLPTTVFAAEAASEQTDLLAETAATVEVYKEVAAATEATITVDLRHFEKLDVDVNESGSPLENAVTALKNAGVTSGALISISAGTLTVTNRQDITMANVIIMGAGEGSTTITGNSSTFNNSTNGLASSSLSSEYKALVGLSTENVKIMDLTVDGGDCGYSKNFFSVADFKTVRINSGVAYLENVTISGSNTRTNLMVGTSSTTATVHAVNVQVNKSSFSFIFYVATEIAPSSTLVQADSVLGGSVVGDAVLGEGYYKLTSNGVTAYTTIPNAIALYNSGVPAEVLTAYSTDENVAQGTTVAQAMTADIVSGKLLYGNDEAQMRAMAVQFRAALADLSEDTGVDVSDCIAQLDSYLVSGTVTYGYTKEVDGYARVWGEATCNASQSLVLELYSGETLLGTTELNNVGGIIDGDVTVTWNFFVPQSNDEYWTTTWEAGMPHADYQPDKVVLYVDGVAAAENVVKMCAPDDLNPVVWAELGGVAPEKTYVVAIGDDKYETLDEALDAAKAAGMTEVEVTVLADISWSDKIGNFSKVTFTGSNREQTVTLADKIIDIKTELVFNDLTVSRLSGGTNWLYHYFYVHGGLSFNDCAMIGLYVVTAQDTDFIGCDFYNDDSFGNGNYSLWLYNCYDGIEVNITGCTFDVYERAIKLFGDGHTNDAVLNVTNTSFASRTEDKTVVEIAYSQNNTENGSYTVNFSNMEYSGFGEFEHTGSETYNTLFNVEVTDGGAASITTVYLDDVQLWPAEKADPKAHFQTGAYASTAPTKPRENLAINVYDIYAEEELRVKVYSNGTLIAESVYREYDLDDLQTNRYPLTAEKLTVNIVVSGVEAGSWENTWHVAPSIAYIPDTFEVWVDGERKDTWTEGFSSEAELNDYIAHTGVYKAASVTDAEGNVSYYATLAAAIEAAQAGETVELLADIDVSSEIAIDKAITVNGGGHTITTASGQNALGIHADVTVEDLIITGGKRGIVLYGEGNDLVLNNVTVTGASHYAVTLYTDSKNCTLSVNDSTISGWCALNIWGDSNTVTVTNSHLTGIGNTTNNNSSYGVIVVNTDNHTVNVSGGTVTAVNSGTKNQQNIVYSSLTSCDAENCSVSVDAELVLDGEATGIVNNIVSDNTISVRADYIDAVNTQGYAYVDNGDGTVTVAKAVAKIGNTNYATLQAAIEAAQPSETVELLSDVNEAGSYMITEGDDITVKGNGYTVNCEDGFYVTGGKLTLCDDLTVKASVYNAVYLRGGEVITSANLYASGAYSAIQGNGSCTGDVTINGGDISSTNDITIYWPQEGKLTINGGTITGSTALYLKSGSLEITGGTLTGNGAKASYEFNPNGATATGEAVVIENVGGDTGYEEITSVSITGGTFITENASRPVASYAATAANPNAVAVKNFITGGLYNKSLASSVIHADMKAKKNADLGMYEIVDKVYVVSVTDAEGNVTKYEGISSLNSNSNAKIPNGSTVTLLMDITTGQLVLGNGIRATVDLNGHTWTTPGATIFVEDGAFLTVQDSSEAQPGKIVSGGDAITVENGALTVKSGTIETTGADDTAISASYADITIEGGKLVSAGDGVQLIYNSESAPNTFTMTGGEIDAAGYGVTGNGTYDYSTVAISGGTITGDAVGIYHPQEGTMTITGGTICGGTGVYVKSGNVTISGDAVINGTGEKADPDVDVNTDGTTSTGDALVVHNEGETTEYGKITITVDGGTFTSANAEAVAAYATGEEPIITGFIPSTSNAAFSTDVSAYCAAGYETAQADDGMYHVQLKEGIVAWNTVTGEVYQTVAMAVAMAGENETVQMLKDSVEENATILLYENITLDLNGKTLTVKYVIGAFDSSSVIDNTNGEGLLVIEKNRMSMLDNSYVPVWIEGEGYRFTSISVTGIAYDLGNGNAQFKFRINRKEGDHLLAQQLADGGADNGITIQVYMSWTNADGKPDGQYFTFSEDLVELYASSWTTKEFILNVTGVEGLTDFAFTAIVTYNDRVEVEGLTKTPVEK